MFLKNTIVAFWMASLLFSTAGVSIHRVYCFCTKTTATSVFFSPKDDCEKPEAAAKMGCCEKPVAPKTCCEKTKTGCDKTHRCTDRSTAFAKLDAKFLVADFLPQLPDFQFVAAVPTPVFFEINLPCPLKLSEPGNKTPPYRASGRSLRQMLCSYQC